MTAEELITSYNTIWKNYEDTHLNAITPTSSVPLLERGFVFQFDQEESQCDVLFMGINPSFSGGDTAYRNFYTKNQEHNYFRPFYSIIDKLNETYHTNARWSHIDLLVFRETDQSFIRDQLFKSDEGRSFIVDLLEIAKKKLAFFQPKVIVVSNTMARELLGRNRGTTKDKEEYGVWMGYHFEFDQDIGTDVITSEGPLQGTKVFFTSMLSGKGVLDKGSRERLIWHIAQVLKR